MRPITALASAAAPLLELPAVLAGTLPAWALSALLGVSVLLAALQMVVTQIIRLRASARITGSHDNLRVLEIEDRPRHRSRRSRPHRPGNPPAV